MEAFVTADEQLQLQDLAGPSRAGQLLGRCGAPVSHLLQVDTLNRIYSRIRGGASGVAFAEQTLEALDVSVEAVAEDLARVPREGPLVLVANHPHGMLDGLVIAAALARVRPDLRIMANAQLAAVPELRDMLTFVDPWSRQTSTRQNFRGVRQSLHWVKEGGALLIFPSGAISRPNLRRRQVLDPEWHSTVGRVIRWAQAPVIPVHIEGGNSRRFQLAGMAHPLFRTMLQPQELLRQAGHTVGLRIGHALSWKQLMARGSDRDIIEYLRFRTYLLTNRRAEVAAPATGPAQGSDRVAAPIVEAGDRGLIAADVEALPADQLLVTAPNRHVYIARAKQIPHLLQEIGRLREVTFRQAGEGTGRAIDLDRCDQDYRHLFVWDTEALEVVGAYRIGLTDELTADRGPAGLYSSLDFQWHRDAPAALGPALELGRSFIQPRYQRQYNALLLLWKGIGRFIVSNPQYTKLFGMVSISGDYHWSSRQLMAAVLSERYRSTELQGLVRPRCALRRRHLRAVEPGAIDNWGSDVSELSAWVADLETEHAGVPVLVRQYIKMGAGFLRFGVSPNFNNTLDGMIVVDLKRTDPLQLKRFFGKDAAKVIGGRAPQDGRVERADDK